MLAAVTPYCKDSTILSTLHIKGFMPKTIAIGTSEGSDAIHYLDNILTLNGFLECDTLRLLTGILKNASYLPLENYFVLCIYKFGSKFVP